MMRAQSRGREDRRRVCRKADGEGHGEDWGLHPSVGKEEKGAVLGCILHTHQSVHSAHTCVRTRTPQSELPRMSGRDAAAPHSGCCLPSGTSESGVADGVNHLREVKITHRARSHYIMDVKVGEVIRG